MKKYSNNIVKAILPALLFSVIIFTANAQKLPGVQKASLRAPADIKIDGQLSEWNDKFQAYQPVSRIFYTVSNDDDNLYLTARMNDVSGNTKVLMGGITFLIKSPKEKGGKSPGTKDASITFPTLNDPRQRTAIINISNVSQRFINDTTKGGKRRLDSLISQANLKMGNLFKEIAITGIKDIQDSLISAYNSVGIKVSEQFDSHMLYTYELAIPLKYLGSSINSGEKFKYNIKLNGRPVVEANGAPTPNTDGPIGGAAGQGGISAEGAYINYPTDFSGEYTLAK